MRLRPSQIKRQKERRKQPPLLMAFRITTPKRLVILVLRIRARWEMTLPPQW